MSPGDLVQHRRDGVTAVVREADTRNHLLSVEMAGGQRTTWRRDAVFVVAEAKRPRGVPSVTDQMLAAERLVREEGATRAELQRLYGKSKATIDGWIEKVREAREQERHLRAVGR